MDGINTGAIVKSYLEGLSTREVAAMYGTNHRRIQVILESVGVPRRDKKSALQKYVRWNTCVVCGNLFRPRENWLSTKNPNRKTCCRACNHIFMSDMKTHDAGCSQPYYQRRRREFYPDVCMDCGSTTRRMDTHHIDRDKSNNTKENLMCLCLKCHAKLHYKEDLITGRFKRSQKEPDFSHPFLLLEALF